MERFILVGGRRQEKHEVEEKGKRRDGGRWKEKEERKKSKKCSNGTHRAQPGTARVTREPGTTPFLRLVSCSALDKTNSINWKLLEFRSGGLESSKGGAGSVKRILMGTEEARLMSFRVETGHWERRLASCLIWAPHSSGRSDLWRIGRPPSRTHLVSSIEDYVAYLLLSLSILLSSMILWKYLGKQNIVGDSLVQNAVLRPAFCSTGISTHGMDTQQVKGGNS